MFFLLPNHLLLCRPLASQGRGKIVVFDPEDQLFELKIEFTDGLLPSCDWVSGDDVFAYEPNRQETEEDIERNAELASVLSSGFYLGLLLLCSTV